MLIKVKVFPKSNREIIKKIKEDKYEIYVIEKARDNEANVRILEILRQLFENNRGVRIIKGHKTQNKIIEVLEPTLPLI